MRSPETPGTLSIPQATWHLGSGELGGLSVFWGAENRKILSHGAEDTADLLCDLGQLAQHLRLQFFVLKCNGDRKSKNTQRF